VPNVKKIRNLNLPGTPWATSACSRVTFTYTHTHTHIYIYCTEILVTAVSDIAFESDSCLLYVDKLRHMKQCTFQTSSHTECSTENRPACTAKSRRYFVSFILTEHGKTRKKCIDSQESHFQHPGNQKLNATQKPFLISQCKRAGFKWNIL
jgi:hypothetical protein